MAYKDLKCSICGEELTSQYWLAKHRKEQHPESVRKYGVKSPPPPSSALDKILLHQRGIQEALREVETERADIQKKLLLLDDLIAKYKKLI